jgi:hypothetical protein
MSSKPTKQSSNGHVRTRTTTTKLHANQFMTLREYAVWDVLRKMAHQKGGVITIDARYAVNTLFIGLSRSTFYELLNSLDARGFVWLDKQPRRKETGWFNQTVIHVFSFDDWKAKRPDEVKRCLSQIQQTRKVTGPKSRTGQSENGDEPVRKRSATSPKTAGNHSENGDEPVRPAGHNIDTNSFEKLSVYTSYSDNNNNDNRPVVVVAAAPARIKAHGEGKTQPVETNGVSAGFMGKVVALLNEGDLPTDTTKDHRQKAIDKAKEVGERAFLAALYYATCEHRNSFIREALNERTHKTERKPVFWPLFTFLNSGICDAALQKVKPILSTVDRDGEILWGFIRHFSKDEIPLNREEAARLITLIDDINFAAEDERVMYVLHGLQAAAYDVPKFLADPVIYIMENGWRVEWGPIFKTGPYAVQAAAAHEAAVNPQSAEGRRPNQRPDDDPYWKELAAKERLAEESGTGGSSTG